MSNTKSPDSAGSSDRVVERATTTSDGGPANRTGPGLWFVAAVASAVIIVDQVTKVWAASQLAVRDIDLVWTLRLHLIENHGSAFGLGSQFGRWLGLLVLGVIVVVINYARSVRDRRMLVLFGAIIGGAIGNVIDRIARADDGVLSGGVIDFIDLQWWPVFNVADIAVVCGAAGLVLLSLIAPEEAVEVALDAENPCGANSEDD